MSEQQSSYRQIMKATSLFGGVQVFNILISIIRSKFVAVLLGPTGMGIMGLLTSTLGLMGSLTNFGLGTSAVKDISAANASSNDSRIGIVVKAIRRLVWITGLIGMLLTAIFAPKLSRLTFGNTEYTFAFIWLSVTLLLSQLSSGQYVVLQGMRKLKYLAKANMLGSLLGLLVTIPLYYYFKINGIVPGLIASSIISFLIAWFYSSKLQIISLPQSAAQTQKEGAQMLKMGFLISFSGILTVIASYFVQLFIRKHGGVEEVGLYNAGFSLINTYVGLVFTAMATDYYPRLSAIASDNKKAKEFINQQAMVAILVLAPILTIFIVFIHWMIVVLYTSKFAAVEGMILWAALGMFFKAVSWSIAMIFLAKGVSGLFFWNELITNIYLFGLNILGYLFAGLEGLGISFLVAYFVYLLQVFIITKIKYQISFDTAFLKIFFIQISLSIACFLVVKFTASPVNFIVGSGFIMISSLFSLRELNRRMDLGRTVRRFKWEIKIK